MQDKGQTMTSDYQAFLESKAVVPQLHGMRDVPPLNPMLRDFQRDCTGWALRTGRGALFQECGLGKTPQQLEFAGQVAGARDGGRVLILAPLAVAHQTVREGVKFNVPVTYAREQSEATGDVVITNYERLDRFDASKFAGVVLDESSILKAYSGAMKQAILKTFAGHRWRLACTATPAPNDYLELGNHAEFLGVLSSHEMIARWFLPDTSSFGKYRLKGHAIVPFWDWVASWARCLSKPSDLGYSDEGYILPELRELSHTLEVDITTGRGNGQLFRAPEMSATQVHQEKRRTVIDRARKVADLVTSEPGETWVIWCETDYEDDALRAVLPEAVSIRGSQDPDVKERSLLAFADGSIRVIITKPKLAGFGLNWQHCARTAFVGPTFSYEAYYQAVRRMWRFGQPRPVDCHVVMAHTEVDVWNIMQEKARAHDAMKVEMFAASKRGRERSEQRAYDYTPKHKGALPSWM